MTFQAYLDTVKAKTGLGPEDFVRIAGEKGILGPDLKASQVYEWLAADYGLGRGHAMAIFSILKPDGGRAEKTADPVGTYFTGTKEKWRPVFDDLLAQLQEFGEVGIAPTNTYLSLLKGSAKFAVVAATGTRLDIGIKLKGVEPTARFAPAGSWNAMVTHRVQVTDASELDTQLLNWLHDAYTAA